MKHRSTQSDWCMAALLSALAHLLCAGCMSAPLNNEQVKSYYVQTSGLTPAATDPETSTAGARIYIDASPDGRSWEQTQWVDGASYPAFIKAETTAVTDAVGTNWYKWSGMITLENLARWKGSLSTHRNTTKLRAYMHGKNRVGRTFDPAHDIALATFENGDATTACVEEFFEDGIMAVINGCKRSANEVNISMECGSDRQRCCATDLGCDAPTRCKLNNYCGSCGANGQEACANSWCQAGLRPTRDGVCGVCGGNGQIGCLNDPMCQSGLKLGSDNICRATTSNPPPPPPPPPVRGGQGNLCYTNGTCNAGLYCVSQVCTPNPPGDCNYQGEWCCPGTHTSVSICYNGLNCNNGATCQY